MQTALNPSFLLTILSGIDQVVVSMSTNLTNSQVGQIYICMGLYRNSKPPNSECTRISKDSWGK